MHFNKQRERKKLTKGKTKRRREDDGGRYKYTQLHPFYITFKCKAIKTRTIKSKCIQLNKQKIKKNEKKLTDINRDLEEDRKSRTASLFAMHILFTHSIICSFIDIQLCRSISCCSQFDLN